MKNPSVVLTVEKPRTDNRNATKKKTKIKLETPIKIFAINTFAMDDSFKRLERSLVRMPKIIT